MIILGILFIVNGLAMLLWLPGYQRKVEAGKVQRDASMPSFRTLRRAAIGIIIFGVLSIGVGSLDRMNSEAIDLGPPDTRGAQTNLPLA